MAIVACPSSCGVGSEYIWHYGCKQSVHQSAGQQHYQLIEQQQQLKLNDLQRERTRVCGTSSSNGSSVHGGRSGQLFDRFVRSSDLKSHWNSRGYVQEGRAVRTLEALKDAERFWTQGGGCRSLVSRYTGISRHGHGGDTVSVSWNHWETGHSLVAAKSRNEARL